MTAAAKSCITYNTPPVPPAAIETDVAITPTIKVMV